MANGDSGIIVVVEGEDLASSAEWFTGLYWTRVTLPEQFRAELARIDPALNTWVAKHSPQLVWGDSHILEGMSHDA